MIDSRPGDAFQPGDLLSNTYRIEELLGRGGTSDVYKARSEISGRLAALKVLKAEFSGNDDYLVLLTREEEIREIRHDAVVRYSENHRTQEGLVYLVMDYVDGPGLDQKLKQGPMPADELLIVCQRVAEGLKAAHDRNIVHRDLSPDNIILRNGDPAQAVIIDFGIAKDTNPGAETIVGNEFAGKYSYAAPEQLNGKTDARSDIYSLGALLLANFRGKPPDVGNNPMEVVQRKAEPLDTSGVPEPLKTLIDRMTDPNPDNRMQSAGEVLRYLNTSGAGPDDPDATVVVPVSSRSGPEGQTDTTVRQAGRSRKSRGGLVAGLLVLLLAAGGAGGYATGFFDAFLGPSYPLADPYTLLVQKPDGGNPIAVGNVPSEEARDELTRIMSGQSGTADLTLASGSIPDSWSADVVAVLKEIGDLEQWRVMFNGGQAQINGKTSDRALQERLSAAFAAGLPGALTGKADIRYEPLFLTAADIEPILSETADCGPLSLPGATAVGYGPDTPITIAGRVAETATRVQLFDKVRSVANDREIVLDLDVLNPTLCLIESHLPSAPESGIDVAFSVGGDNQPNPSGRFFVGENPVIDVVLPADVTDGYLTVSVLDVSGNVFHLLPNLGRQDNAVAHLRAGQTGEARVRVAYSLQEAANNDVVAFKVDDSTLGKSKVIVLHSSEPLFDGLRPTTESAVGYAEALQTNAQSNAASILSLDSRILTTAKP